VEHDDKPIGRVLSRREVLASLGAVGAASFIPGQLLRGDVAGRLLSIGGVPIPACVVRPAQTEGPYFVDTRLNRSDIRSDPTDGAVPEGAALKLAFRIARLDGSSCRPLEGALVDVWQCDAVGVYSGVKDINGFFDTTGKQFLRGHQITGPEGIVEFHTLYPGWYQGRTVHIHFKIRTDPESERGTEFASQIYFSDEQSDRVFTRAPYASVTGERTRNEGDGIFRNGGQQLLVDVEPDGDGYTATFDVGLQMD
jgi:protocatechuate 3,4-dioxygenase beta subunit